MTRKRARLMVRAVEQGTTGDDLRWFFEECLRAHERDTLQSLMEA